MIQDIGIITREIFLDILTLTEIEKQKRPELKTKGIFIIKHGFCAFDNTGEKLLVEYTDSYNTAKEFIR